MIKNSKIKTTDILYAAAIVLFSSVCYKLFLRMCTSDSYESDFTWYINLPTSEHKERHRMLGWLFDLMYRHGINVAGMVIYLAAVIGCIILANFLYLKFFTKESRANRPVLQIASLMGPFMGAIYVPIVHPYYYRWSFQSFAWHSPTQQSMILYSIPALLCFIKMYEESETKVNLKWWLLTMISGLVSVFAKPSFIIDLIPAMIALFLIDLVVQNEESFINKLKRLVVMGCSLIPAGLYMLAVMKYSFNGEGSMSEGEVILDIRHVLDYPNLWLAVICGLAFPLVAWIVNFRLVKEKRYRTVLMIFFMGVMQWMLLTEQGERAAHGNFTWGRQVGCYFFFLTAIAIAVNNYYNKDFLSNKPMIRKAYFGVIAILLFLHIASQMRYFYLICMGHKYLC